MELGFAFVHVHTGVKSFSGSLRLWFKKFTLAAIPVPLHGPGKAGEDSFVSVTFTAPPKQHLKENCSPQAAPEIQPCAHGASSSAEVQAWASTAASPRTSRAISHKAFIQKLFLSSSSVY